MPARIFSSLPPEIIDCIFGYTSSEELKHLAIVCSTFRPHAQRLIFQTTSLLFSRERILPTHEARNPHVLSFVRTLWLASGDHLPWADSSHDSFAGFLTIGAFLQSLPTTPRLKYLIIACDGGRQVAVALLERLPAGRFVQVKLTVPRLIPDQPTNPLPIDAMELGLGVQAPDPLLICAAHSLQSLTIESTNSTTLRIPDGLLFPRLTRFVLTCTSPTDLSPLISFFASHNSIQQLELGHNSYMLSPIPPSILPNLHKLHASIGIVVPLIPERHINDLRCNSCPSPRPQGHTSEVLLQAVAKSLRPITSFALTTVQDNFFPHDLGPLVDLLSEVQKLSLVFFYPCHLDTSDVLLILRKLKHLRSLTLLLTAPKEDRHVARPAWFDESLTEILETLQGGQAVNMRCLDHLDICRLGPSSTLVVRHTASRIGWQNSVYQPRLHGEWKLETERFGARE